MRLKIPPRMPPRIFEGIIIKGRIGLSFSLATLLARCIHDAERDGKTVLYGTKGNDLSCRSKERIEEERLSALRGRLIGTTCATHTASIK